MGSSQVEGTKAGAMIDLLLLSLLASVVALFTLAGVGIYLLVKWEGADQPRPSCASSHVGLDHLQCRDEVKAPTA